VQPDFNQPNVLSQTLRPSGSTPKFEAFSSRNTPNVASPVCQPHDLTHFRTEPAGESISNLKTLPIDRTASIGKPQSKENNTSFSLGQQYQTQQPGHSAAEYVIKEVPEVKQSVKDSHSQIVFNNRHASVSSAQSAVST